MIANAGRFDVDPMRAGDVVVARKDIATSYHLAVVVDDALQGVTCVTRGEDLLEATHIHRVLQFLLDLPAPEYAHHVLAGRCGRQALRETRQGEDDSRAAGRGYAPAEVRKMAQR